MKTYLLLLAAFFLLLKNGAFAQTVYITETGSHYHTKACKYVGKTSTAVPLWKAFSYRKTPCRECHPPTTETTSAPAKKKKGPIKKVPTKKATVKKAATKKPAPVIESTSHGAVM